MLPKGQIIFMWAGWWLTGGCVFAADVSFVVPTGPRGLMFHPFLLSSLAQQTLPAHETVVVIGNLESNSSSSELKDVNAGRLVLDTRATGLVYAAKPEALRSPRGPQSDPRTHPTNIQDILGGRPAPNGMRVFDSADTDPRYFMTGSNILRDAESIKDPVRSKGMSKESKKTWQGLADEMDIDVPRFMTRISNLRYYFTTRRLFPFETRMLGVSWMDQPRSEYVSFIDDDDYLHPQRLEMMYSVAHQRDLDAVYHRCEFSILESSSDIAKFKAWREHQFTTIAFPQGFNFSASTTDSYPTEGTGRPDVSAEEGGDMHGDGHVSASFETRIIPPWSFWIGSDGLTDYSKCSPDDQRLLDELYRWSMDGSSKRIAKEREKLLRTAGKIKSAIPIVWPQIRQQPPEREFFDMRFITVPETHWEMGILMKGAFLLRTRVLQEVEGTHWRIAEDVYYFWRLIRNCKRIGAMRELFLYYLHPHFDEI